MSRMKTFRTAVAGVVVLFTAVALMNSSAPVETAAASKATPSAAQSNVTVFATGLNNPRGLRFGPDGKLYVAEGGTGGTNSTVGTCEQVPFPIGPYTGSTTGARVSRIDAGGVRTTVADNLPSSQASPLAGSPVEGAQDVEFVGNALYVLLAGAGCSHGVAGVPNAVLRVNPDGSTTQVADLSAFLQANPVAHPDAEDFEPDGTWYSMVAVNGDLYATEPNHGEIDRISPVTGHVSRVVEMSSEPWWGPTALAYKGDFFVGNLSPFPIVPGGSQVRKLTPSGNFKTWASGLTAVVGLAFDRRDRLYALESMTAPGFPGPGQFGTGKVVRIEPSGKQTLVAGGLVFPTAMTFGPDGALYVSNFGFGLPPIGLGQVVRIEIPEDNN